MPKPRPCPAPKIGKIGNPTFFLQLPHLQSEHSHLPSLHLSQFSPFSFNNGLIGADLTI